MRPEERRKKFALAKDAVASAQEVLTLVDELLERVTELEEENERLQAIVDRE